MKTMPDFDTFSGGECAQLYKCDGKCETNEFGEKLSQSILNEPSDFVFLVVDLKAAGCDARHLVYSGDNDDDEGKLVFVEVKDKKFKKYNRPKNGATNLQVKVPSTPKACPGDLETL